MGNLTSATDPNLLEMHNIKSVLNDPPDVVMTEVLCRWVVAINSAVDSASWGNCLDKSVDLDLDKLTWLAIDLSPDRRHASLVGAQKIGEENYEDQNKGLG